MKTLLSFFATLVTILSPGIQTTGTPPVDTFITLADSTDWGSSGAVMDLTDAIPQFRPLDVGVHPVYAPALPLDTTGWTTVVPAACTETAIETTISNITTCNTVVDISACSLVNLADDSQAQEDPHIGLSVSGSDCKHGLVLRGDPVNRTTLRVNRTADPRTIIGSGTNVRDSGVILGTGGDFVIPTTFAWDTGREMNSTVVGSNSAITGVYEGDILEIGVTPLGSPYNNEGTGTWRFVRRVLCAKWNDGTEHPSGCGTTYGIVTNNRIKIDHEITSSWETTGPYRFSSLLSGHYIGVLENMGYNGNPSTNNNYVYLGIENINFEHDQPYTLSDFRPAIRTDQVAYAWIENVRVGEWGAHKIQPGRTVAESSQVLIRNSEFEGEVWKGMCIASITSLSQTNPVQLTISTAGTAGAGCNGTGEWNGSTLNPVVYIDPTCSVTQIRGIRGYDIVSGWSGSSVTISLTGVDGTGLNTNPGCYAVNHRYFGTSTIHVGERTGGVQIINNTFLNTKVGVLIQGAWNVVAAYNEFKTTAGYSTSRALFNHEGMAPILWEGNVSNGQTMSLYNSAHANGPGRGPHFVTYRNHFLADGGASTSGIHGDLTNGSLAHLENARENMDGTSSHFTVLFGNLFTGATGSLPLDSVDNDNDGNTAEEIASFGPYYNEDFRATGNLYRSFNGDSLFSSGGTLNPTTLRDDTEADESTELSEGDRTREYPTSLLYSATPSWWCSESGSFPNVGAPSYTASNPPNIPSTIRRVGFTCTPP